MEYMQLLGTETVQNASRSMQGAAETIQRAVANLDVILFQQQRFMDDWLDRLQKVIEKGE